MNSDVVPSNSYCRFAPEHPVHGPYHDHEYGFPVQDDRVLFERLILEINQAGLSWLTILKKRENFRRAYSGFDIDAVAAYDEGDRAPLLIDTGIVESDQPLVTRLSDEGDRTRLLNDAGIIRNRLKVNAAIENARRLVVLRQEFDSFAGWLDHHHPRTKPEWVKLFKRTFKFTGGEITGEFLMSTGYLPGAHDTRCPVYAKVAAQAPPWMRSAA